MWLLFIFVVIPIIEISLFITVGSWIGLWPTLMIVIVTAIAGTALLRTQGSQVLRQLQGSFSRLDDPTQPLANGAMILLSGVLLVTPGFFTDTLGLLLLVPAVREWVFRFLRARVSVQSFQMGGSQDGTEWSPPPDRRRSPDVIDGEFYEIDPDKLPPRPNRKKSGWTRD